MPAVVVELVRAQEFENLELGLVDAVEFLQQAIHRIDLARFEIITDGVTLCGAVARHQDQRRGVGGLRGKRQVQEDKGVGVPTEREGADVQHDPDSDNAGLDDDEAPRAECADDGVRGAFAEVGRPSNVVT